MKDENKEYDPAKVWLWDYKEKSDEELKNIAKDMYHNVIFTNMHIRPNDQHLTMSVFMAFALMGPGMHSDGEREGAIDNILEEEHYQKWLENIGMIYEFMEKASPRGINGYPIFMSVNMLNKKDTEKVLDFYNKYSELQKKLEEDF